MEELKEVIKGYFVSRDGKVYSKRKYKVLTELKQQIDRLGYVKVNVSRTTWSVHRLVALAYIPNPNNYKEINHKDGNKQNNTVENLEWCSRSYNVKHAFAMGLKKNKKGSEHCEAKKVYQFDLDGNLIREWGSITECETFYNLQNVSCCAKHKIKTCGGFIFEYQPFTTEERIYKANYPATAIKIIGTNLKDGSTTCYNSIHDTEKDGFIATLVCKCLKGKRKTHKGFSWKYCDN